MHLTSTKLRLFNFLQLTGWLGLAVLTYFALTLWYTTSGFWLNTIHILLCSLLGLLLSLLLRKVFLLLWDKPIASRMLLSVVSLILLALLWNVLRLQLYFWIVLGGSASSLQHSNWEFDKASIFFNFGVEGASVGEKTYYWDDVNVGVTARRAIDSPSHRGNDEATSQIDLPVNFENEDLDYTVNDFGGAFTVFETDPSGRRGTVAMTTKPSNGKSWAGTTIGTVEGFAAKIPVTIANSTMTVWVYSPDAGIPVLLKLEDHNNPTHMAEADTSTTLINTWEALVFDFNDVPADSIKSKYVQVWRDFGGWYFTSLLILLCWSALYHGIKYALLFQAERNEATGLAQRAKLSSVQASEATKEAQLQMLRYQLNPHFMFNTLNAIYALIKLGDQVQAKGMVAKLGKFLRYSLDSEPSQLVSLSQELDALKLYLDIEKIRFDQRLRVEIDVEPLASLCLVPSLILQPLVENAVKYAITEQENGGKIVIEATVMRGQLVLTVSDDGPGVELVNGKLLGPCGIGLGNTQQRLLTLYGERQSFVLEHVAPQGLRIVMRLPYQKTNEKI
ncbi:MAG: hypothetical protein ACI8Z9_002326 [Paraglaciecola sp.]